MYLGTQGTSGNKIYDLKITSTGLTENAAKEIGIEVNTVTVVDNYRPKFMPSFDSPKLKVVWEEQFLPTSL